jgi:hypothetical protein
VWDLDRCRYDSGKRGSSRSVLQRERLSTENTEMAGATGGFNQMAVGLSGFLARHRIGAVWVTAVLILTTADTGRRAFAENGPHVGALTWIAIGLMVTSPAWCGALLKLVRPEARLSIGWAAALAPFLYGYTAVATGSPMYLMWVGVALCLVLLVWVLASTSRTTR